MSKEKICIVENDPVYSRMLIDQLNLDESLELMLFSSGKSLIENLHINPFSILLSASLPDIKAEDMIRRIREYNPDIQLVMLCSQSQKNLFNGFQKLGVKEILLKDTDIKLSVSLLIGRLRHLSRLMKEITELKEQAFKEHPPVYHPNGSTRLEKPLSAFIRKVSLNKMPVLILSHLGAEPESIARLIHQSSNRVAFPFSAVNLRSIPRAQFNHVLFGEKPSGPLKKEGMKTGVIPGSDGGSVFLEHIDVLIPEMQEKLLKFFAKSTYRIKGNKEIASNVRFIFSTEKNLQALISEGKLLSGFYNYIHSQTFKLIPLKDRLSEIPAIASKYIEDYCNVNHLKIKTLHPEASVKLMMHSYPEDLSELKMILQRAIALTPSEIITEEAVHFTESYFNPDLSKGTNSPYEVKVQMVAHSLKVHNNKVSLVCKELKMGKSTIYRMRDKGLVHF